MKAEDLVVGKKFSLDGCEFTVVLNRLASRYDPCVIATNSEGQECGFTHDDLPDMVG